MHRSIGLLVLSSIVLSIPLLAGDSTGPGIEPSTTASHRPLIHAHAHNDYHQERPLLDALSHGFCSVEADIFLVDGRLLVGHSRLELRPDRTIESLYLDPLLDRVRRNGGLVFQGGPGFTLLVDIKTGGEETYLALDALLAEYGEMLTAVVDDDVRERAVSIIISGNRAWHVIAADPTRFAAVDGRLTDLPSDRPDHLMPLISDRWGKYFTWSGAGPMPDAERAELGRIIREAHANGRRIRFWATPDHPSPDRTAVWNELVAAQVDLIGTDDLDGLEAYLLSMEASAVPTPSR